MSSTSLVPVEEAVAPSAAMQGNPVRMNSVGKIRTKRKCTKVALPENALREIFLKDIFYIDRDHSKFVVAGYFENYDKPIGILFKTGNSYIYWPFDVLNSFLVHLNEITSSLENATNKYKLTIDGGNEVKIRNVFGKFYVSIRDSEHTILLNKSEWSQFLLSVHEVKKHLADLFYNEQLITSFIERILIAENEDDAIPPEGLPTHFVNKLVDEVLFCKKWLVWNRGRRQQPSLQQ